MRVAVWLTRAERSPSPYPFLAGLARPCSRSPRPIKGRFCRFHPCNTALTSLPRPAAGPFPGWATRSCRPRSASLNPSSESAGLAALPPAALPDPSSESAGLAGLAHVTACNGRIFGVCGPTWARRALAGLALQCLEPSTVGPGLAGLALTAPKNRGPGRCAALLPALARPRAPPPQAPINQAQTKFDRSCRSREAHLNMPAMSQASYLSTLQP